MKIEIHNPCSDFNSYRAARVKSLFNAESGCNFDLEAELPIDDGEWQVGLIVGPSGSGKTSMGHAIFGTGAFYRPVGWPHDKPIIDAIAPGGGVRRGDWRPFGSGPWNGAGVASAISGAFQRGKVPGRPGAGHLRCSGAGGDR